MKSFTSLLFLALSFAWMQAQCNTEPIDRAGWSIHSFDTQEANGEGQNNGRAIHAIDNNLNTYWHSRWQNFTPSYPHFIAVDMGAVEPLNGLSIVSRADGNSAKPRAYNLYLSTDGENWGPVQSAGNFSYPNPNGSGQTASITFMPVNARYFKIEILSNYSNDPHIAIAEIYANRVTGGGDCEPTGQNNQVLNVTDIEQVYADDAPFTIDAVSNSGLPLTYTVISGPATISGNQVTLTGEGGTLVIGITQEGNSEYYPLDYQMTITVINTDTIAPSVHTRITEEYPVEMNQLMPYPLYAYANITEEEVLSIANIEFLVNGVAIETEFENSHAVAWWTPAEFGTHTILIRAIGSNGMSSEITRTLNVTQPTGDRYETTIDNGIIDFGTMGVQWYYGTFTMPQFVGTYDHIKADWIVTCPNVPGGCDDWDRLAFVQIKNPQGQWIELIRYITPYGIACSHDLDVTDYESVLQGEVEFRVYIDTWGTGGWQFTLNLDYQLGTPEYAYTAIQELWQGYYQFGDPANLQPMPVRTIIAPDNAEETQMRVVTTGHGWGQNNTSNAAEFYYATHHFRINGVNTFTQALRQSCNPNPDGCNGQFGTWYHDRAGWCPGAIAPPYMYDLTPHTQNPFQLEYIFHPTYQDYCHPNNPNCVSGQTCPNCNDGYNPHYRIGGYMIHKSNVVMGQLSVDEVARTENVIAVLPNPNNGIFRMSMTEEAGPMVVQVFDASGKSVYLRHFQNREQFVTHTFHMSHVPAGVYYVRVQNEKDVIFTKMIKK